jgi:hypothetical protein
MEELHVFDDLYSAEEQQEIKIDESLASTFSDIKQKLIEGKYSYAKDYLKNATSVEEIVITAAAYRIGEEYAAALQDDLDIEEKKVALFGFKNELNVIEQIKGGEALPDLVTLIEASKIPGFELMSFFDETGSYINYPKIRKFIQENS